MRNAIGWIGATAGVLILLGATCAVAQDWPQWRGAGRDGKVANFTAPAEWPKELKQGWRVTVGKGDSTPALVGDRLYVFARQGDDEVTLCLSAADGKELWRDTCAAPAISGADAGQHPGPRSSPAVAEGKVVTLGVNGVVSCLNAADGKLVWRKDEFPRTWPQFHTASSPMIAEGRVIAQLGSEANGALMAFDLANGDVKWKWAGEGTAYASPVLMTVDGVRQVVALTSRSVVGLGLADGKLLWQFPFAPGGKMGYNAATPIIEGQTVYVAGSGRGTKALKIEKQGDGFAAKEAWTNPDAAVQFNTPVLSNGFLFGLTNQGFLFCISAADGKTAWQDTTKRGPQRGGAGFAAIVSAGGVMMALPNMGELIVYRPVGEAFEALATIRVAEGGTYAHPVASGNRIFIKDPETLTLLTIP